MQLIVVGVPCHLGRQILRQISLAVALFQIKLQSHYDLHVESSEALKAVVDT
jgi:hypothetical protein